jgi:hypothetical protein
MRSNDGKRGSGKVANVRHTITLDDTEQRVEEARLRAGLVEQINK